MLLGNVFMSWFNWNRNRGGRNQDGGTQWQILLSPNKAHNYTRTHTHINKGNWSNKRWHDTLGSIIDFIFPSFSSLKHLHQDVDWGLSFQQSSPSPPPWPPLLSTVNENVGHRLNYARLFSTASSDSNHWNVGTSPDSNQLILSAGNSVSGSDPLRCRLAFGRALAIDCLRQVSILVQYFASRCTFEITVLLNNRFIIGHAHNRFHAIRATCASFHLPPASWIFPNGIIPRFTISFSLWELVWFAYWPGLFFFDLIISLSSPHYHLLIVIGDDYFRFSGRLIHADLRQFM